MIWRDEKLKNPFSGKVLRRDSPHSLTDGDERFPVIEEIPFLRANRNELRRAVLKKLDAGATRDATVLLLQDGDDWASGEPPTATNLHALFDDAKLTLRDAMRLLNYGAVADYFAFRWSDPTFLSGLCLLENHLPPNAEKVFELCCGIGHFLREFGLRGISATGADVVFSKLWLARKFVAPEAKLICLDANFPLPFAGESFDAAFCHDAFYFLPEKRAVAKELKRTTGGAILIGHAHNSDAENFSSGAAVAASEYAEIFRSEKTNSVFYDDEELTRAAIENRKPAARTIADLKTAAAIDLVYRTAENGARPARRKSFLVPTVATRDLRINPLLAGENGEVFGKPVFPSERYAKEYGELSAYLKLSAQEVEFVKKMRGGAAMPNDRISDGFLRRRIFLDLPENW